LPAEAVIAGTDVGALAFWTGRRVVNLDGVMNDFEFQKTLRDRKLADYLRRQGVTHIGTALWDADQTYTARPTEPMYRHQIDPDATHGRPYDCHWFYVHSYVYRVDSDRICLPAAAEVFVNEAGRRTAHPRIFAMGGRSRELLQGAGYAPDTEKRGNTAAEFVSSFD
jgi:hypothetical protein